jgi:hypothetical protein
MRRAAIIAADAQSCYRPRRRGIAIYVDGVLMTTDRLLGVLVIVLAGVAGWLLFDDVMATPIMLGPMQYPVILAAVVVYVLLIGSLFRRR